MEEEQMKDRRKKTIISVLGLVLLVVLVIGITYAAFSYTKKGEVENTIRTATITMSYDEGENGIDISDALPMEDAAGMLLSGTNQVFDFTVSVNIVGRGANIQYEVTADKQESSTLSNNEVRIYLEKSVDGTTYNAVGTPNAYTPLAANDEFGASAGEMVIDRGTVNNTVKYYYRLRMWVSNSYNASSSVKTFTVKVNVYGSDGVNVKYSDNTGANSPELVGDMIPVVYDSAKSSWVKADINTEWYNYEKQEWANAVTIADPTRRASYKAALAGTQINQADINTMWVWIPRYSYTLGNTYGTKLDGASEPSKETPGAFDIKFIKSDTLDVGSGQYTGSTPSNFYTPSSFCWGNSCDNPATRGSAENKELSGLWVSKFEVTGTHDTTAGTISAITSLPNQDSIRNQTHATFFNSIRNLMNGTNGTNTYGFSGQYDAHMMKNTEWGAQAYLSQSRYGKYGNVNFTGVNKEVYINNYYSVANSGAGGQTLTGCSAGRPGQGDSNASNHATECAYTYEVFPEGTGASTTGNITGIYDTSGGAWEKMMGNYQNTISQSGFEAMPEQKYYNLYTGTVGIKGDATNADGTAGFYGDYAVFVASSVPWAAHSGPWWDGPRAGSFCFNVYHGGVDDSDGSRLVLVAA